MTENDLMKTLKCITTRKDLKWIDEIQEFPNPIILMKFLVHQTILRKQLIVLNKYAYHLTPKMFAIFAWSMIPKYDKTPYFIFTKPFIEKDDLQLLTNKIRKHLIISDNDYNNMKYRLIKDIKDNMKEWFKYYAMPIPLWKKYSMDYKYIMSGEKRVGIQQSLNKNEV